MPRALLQVLLLVIAVLLGGCNTVRGIGQDLQKAGEKIEESAKKK